MGLHQSTHGTGKRVYLSINELGSVVQKSKEPAEGYAERVIESGAAKGKTVYEKSYDYIDGYLQSVSVKSTDFGGVHIAKGQWEFVLTDDEGLSMYLSLPFSSGYAKNIVNSLCSVESFGVPLSIKPYKFIPKGETKTKQGVVIRQNGEKIPWKFAIADLPALEKVKVKGQEVTDDSAQLEFYEKAVHEIIAPKLSGGKSKGVQHDEEIESIVIPF
jgi:hypothetical protein